MQYDARTPTRYKMEELGSLPYVPSLETLRGHNDVWAIWK
jgi:hypothetical protein